MRITACLLCASVLPLLMPLDPRHPLDSVTMFFSIKYWQMWGPDPPALLMHHSFFRIPKAQSFRSFVNLESAKKPQKTISLII